MSKSETYTLSLTLSTGIDSADLLERLQAAAEDLLLDLPALHNNNTSRDVEQSCCVERVGGLTVDDRQYHARLKFFGMTALEAEQSAVVGAYLHLCAHTDDGVPMYSLSRTEARRISPWDRQGRHPDGTPTEEAFTEPELVRAAMERAAPWLTAEGK